MKIRSLLVAACAALGLFAPGVFAQSGKVSAAAPRPMTEPETQRLVGQAMRAASAEYLQAIPAFTGDAFEGAPVELTVLSGSESLGVFQAIEPDLARVGVSLTVQGTGSWDIERVLGVPALRERYDVFSPGTGNWLTPASSSGVISAPFSAARSPVVLAIRRAEAEKLGWLVAAPTALQISDTVVSGKLTVDETSVSQSMTGFGFVVSLLSSESQGESLETFIKDPKKFPRTRAFLASVNNSSSSTGHLATNVVQEPARYQAFVTYEYHLVAVNVALASAGQETFVPIYPADGVFVATMPVALRDKVGAEKRAAFERLRSYIASPRGQYRIALSGRRPSQDGANVAQFAGLFSPAAGFKVGEPLKALTAPEVDVTRQIFDGYASDWRRPSITVVAVSYGETMKGERVAQLRSAWSSLFGPEATSAWMGQGPHDITVVLPYGSSVWSDRALMLVGNKPEDLEAFRAKLLALEPTGGNATYSAARAALEKAAELSQAKASTLPAIFASRGYNVSVVLLTDDMATDQMSVLDGAPPGIRLHTTGFGRARPSDLHELAARFGGRCVGAERGVYRALSDLLGMNK